MCKSDWLLDWVIVFWMFLFGFLGVVKVEVVCYFKVFGVICLYMDIIMKLVGIMFKLFGLMEGYYLVLMDYYLCWVQYWNDDLLIEEYCVCGYLVWDNLEIYLGIFIVGFLIKLMVGDFGIGDKLVFVVQVIVEEQYKWLIFGEFFYIVGVILDGWVCEDIGNQISYIFKYKFEDLDLEGFWEMFQEWQLQV